MSKEKNSYLEEEIEFSIGEVTLAGTIVSPKKEGIPCAVLLSGYGSVTRDNSSKEFKRYHFLAEQLAKEGIASLRFDDRGSGKSTKVNWHDYTFDELADEALAAVKLVKTKSNIDSEKIGFIGHSLGGTVGPLAANKNNEIAFVISAAPHGLIGIDTALNTRNAMARSMGESEEQIANWSKILREILQDLLDRKSEEHPLTVLKQAMHTKYEQISEELKSNFPTLESFIGATYEGFLLAFGDTPMYKSFLAFDPQEMYKQLKCPILLLFAGEDLLHPSIVHKKVIESALDAPNKNITFHDFPDANHNFTKVEKQTTTGFVNGFCNSIIDWLKT